MQESWRWRERGREGGGGEEEEGRRRRGGDVFFFFKVNDGTIKVNDVFA